MLRIVVISSDVSAKNAVAHEIGSLLESLKVGVEYHDIEDETEGEHVENVRELHGEQAVLSGMVL